MLAAARDPSSRVRLKVAAAFARSANPAASAAARRMLNDPSAEVERQVVRSLASWPLEAAVPVLLDALTRNAASVRKLAADQLRRAGRESGRFPCEAPPARRAEALAGCGSDAERIRKMPTAFVVPASAGTAPIFRLKPVLRAADQQVEKLVGTCDFAGLAAVGPEVVASLGRMAVQRHLTLPEPVYRDVLPRYSPIFAALDRMGRGQTASRRQAAGELAALARKQPIGELAAARLSALMAAETDTMIWLCAGRRHNDGSEPAVRMAAATGQNAGEVRHRACEFLAAHPDPANEPFLVPCLASSEQNVVLAATAALGVAGRMANAGVLEKQLGSAGEEVQLATAVALARLRDPAAGDALRRLSYSGDFHIRGRLARNLLGELGDERYAAILVRLLDDSKATVSHAALASLPRVVGRDVAQWATAQQFHGGTDGAVEEVVGGNAKMRRMR